MNVLNRKWTPVELLIGGGLAWLAWQAWQQLQRVIPNGHVGGMDWRSGICPSCYNPFEYEWIVGGLNATQVACPFCGVATGYSGTGRTRHDSMSSQ